MEKLFEKETIFFTQFSLSEIGTGSFTQEFRCSDEVKNFKTGTLPSFPLTVHFDLPRVNRGEFQFCTNVTNDYTLLGRFHFCNSLT